MRLAEGDCVLPVDKPIGPTSHDVVALARRSLRTRRIGHTGTLDPFASGLLILCVGRATRLAEYMSGMDKHYEAVARLGAETDTLDLDGQLVSGGDSWRDLDHDSIEAALRDQVGQFDQVPPRFSAKKVGGERMHRRARRGEDVELHPVAVTVYQATVMDVTLPEVRFSVHCSTGTYVRGIARDLGRALGCGAHLTMLRRTSVGHFHVDSALRPESFDDAKAVDRARLEPFESLRHLPTVSVDRAVSERIRNGQRVRVDEPGRPSEPLVTVTCGTDLVAMASLDDGVLRPRKVFPE